MAENIDYKALFEEAEKRSAEDKRAREEAEQRSAEAERAREEAEQRAGEEKHRREEAELAIRKTTLREYLQACQDLVLANIVLHTDGYLTTKAPSTNPTNKHCPRFIRPWHGFVETQRKTNKCIDRIIPRDARLFESLHFLEVIGGRVHSRAVYCEADLVCVQNNAVEDPVRVILDQMKNFQPEQQGVFLHNGIHFQTTETNFREDASGSNTKRDRRLRTDQICVLRNDQERSVVYVVEYKAPKRLHTAHLDKGLRAMDILEEVVNKATIPNFEPAKFQHTSELLTAAALTQTYHYMIEAGLEYGCLANGEAIVFLKLDWSDPTILLYHFARPLGEVEVDGDPVYSNAVCQLLAFTVLALQSQQHTNDERVKAASRCAKWEVDFDRILEIIASTEAQTTPTEKKHRRVPSSPGYQESPIKKRKRGPGPDQPDTESDRVLRSHNRRDDSGDGSGSTSGMSGGGAGPGGGGGGGGGGSSFAGERPAPGSASTAGHAAQQQQRPYCTPLCLLSLVHGRALDRKCPNAALHRGEHEERLANASKKASALQKHPVSHAQWMVLLREQLSKSLDQGVVVLRQEGASGALFQITLLQYGYTFVAKGMMSHTRLQREEAVYERLQVLQGRHIPVCLGSVDLQALGQVYYYDFDVRLVYFLLMSYGGTAFRSRPDAEMEDRHKAALRSILEEMHRLGVVHGDVRLPNILLSPTGQVTVIDFDRAQLLPATDDEADDTTLRAVSSNKRKRLSAGEDGEDGPDSKAKKVAMAMARLGQREDHSNTESIFTLDDGRILGWPR